MNDKEKSNIKAIAQILFRNKVGNYTMAPMKLIAYIIVKFGEEHTVELSFSDNWINENFTKVQFHRSVSFLKLKDVLQRKGKNEDVYKVNFRYLSNIVSEELDVDALLEINSFFKRRKKKLKVKKLKTSGAKANSKVNQTIRHNVYSNKDIANSNSNKETLMPKAGTTLSFMSKVKTRKKRKKKIRKDSTEMYGQFKFNPSENPKLQSWQDREIDEWRSIDFLGYYICLYKEATGFENITLQNDQAYSKVKKMIRAMLRDWFNDKKDLMQKYLKWSVQYFTHEMDGRYSPSIETLLNPYKQTRWVYDLFVKNQSKKGKRSKDNKWASDKNWR